MIRIVNKKVFTGDGEYIGRPSVLGNPFAVGRDGSREQVIAKYRVWLWEQINQRGKVWEELLRLAEVENLTLICFCKPLACHGDVVKAAVEWLREDLGGVPRWYVEGGQMEADDILRQQQQDDMWDVQNQHLL